MTIFSRSLGLIVLLSVPLLARGQTYVGRVQAVLDGDTIRLLRDTGQIVQVELYGVDAPELGQPFGREAAQAVRRVVFRSRVRAAAESRDEDGRPLVVVYVDDRILNEVLLRKGLAWWERRHAAHEDHYRRLERQARSAKRGLWAQSRPVPPWDWRAEKDGS